MNMIKHTKILETIRAKKLVVPRSARERWDHRRRRGTGTAMDARGAAFTCKQCLRTTRRDRRGIWTSGPMSEPLDLLNIEVLTNKLPARGQGYPLALMTLNK